MTNLEDAKGVMEKFTLRQRGEAIRKFRKEAKLSLDELGAMVGLSGAMVSRFERGLNDLSLEAFARLQGALNEILSEVNATRRLAVLRKKAPRNLFALEAGMLAGAIGHARKGATISTEVARPDSTLGAFIQSAFDSVVRGALDIAARRCEKLEQMVRLQKGLIKGQEKLIAMYEAEFAKQPEILRHWENEFRLRKEAEASFRRQIDELQEQLANAPVPQNQEKDGN